MFTNFCKIISWAQPKKLLKSALSLDLCMCAELVQTSVDSLRALLVRFVEPAARVKWREEEAAIMGMKARITMAMIQE